MVEGWDMSKKRNAAPATKDAPFAVQDWPAMRPKLRPVSQIIPYPNNPRTHPPAQIEMLARLIKQFGPDQPIVVDGDKGPERGMILKGHGRRAAAIMAGLEEFPVVERFGMTSDEKRAMRIDDNQVALLSGWDNELVRGEIMSLRTAGYDVALLGFGDTQLVQFTTLPAPPSQFQQFGSDIPTQFCCPSCNYKWSGKPTPGE
jgi:hypothetical protein